jgi:ATP-dependent helicase/nuclease subunit B
MALPRPNLFSIAPGVPFLPTLADAILSGRLIAGWSPASDPLALSEATIFLPTRRAARALHSMLAEKSPAASLLLPRIVPLGDVEDAEDHVLFDGGSDRLGEDGALPPEADPMVRRLTLAQFVLTWSGQIRMRLRDHDPDTPMPAKLSDAVRRDPQGFIVATSARDALSLADALGRLIDSLTIHGRGFADLHRQVPGDFDEYWRLSRDFVKIAAEEWPKFCRLTGVMDASERRHRLLLAEAERLTRERPEAPMIVAGSTGSMPATAALIAAIARLPRGAVVLPGLDHHLDPAEWALLGQEPGEPGHPQALLAQLLTRIGVAPDAVRPLGEPAPALKARELMLGEALRPAETTDRWQTRAERLPDTAIAEALADMRLVEAEDEREEALAIAAMLRETLETPGRIAALVTPDRTLAERVSSELGRWSITVEDSAGLALSRSLAGRLACLAADVFTADFPAAALLALLDHPLLALGLAPETLRRGRRTLEIGVLRGAATHPGLDGIRAALHQKRGAPPDHPPEPLKRLTEADWDAAALILNRLAEAFAPLTAIGRDRIDLVAATRALGQVTGALARTAEDEDLIDRAEGGEALAALFDDLDQGAAAMLGHIREWPGFLDGLMAGRTVRRGGASHARIRIWGLLEARLLSVDRLVLGGLDETVWPPVGRTDPFLSRAMAEALGLPAPERRIGQTAHDFAQACGAPDLVLTRAKKRDGNPMVASRFLQRLRAVIGEDLYGALLARGARVLDWVRALDRLENAPPRVRQPAPVPPRELLPRRLSVTQIETLRRDPYSIYAKAVLRLDALRPLAEPPGSAERGNAIHDALAKLAERHPRTLPATALDELLALGRESFGDLAREPEFEAFWWPNFVRGAQWLIAWDHGRRADGTEIRAEKRGSHRFDLPGGGDFTISARADRIEIHPGSRFSVVDYKTGRPPGKREVRCGFSPQLTITAALVSRGGFDGITGTPADLLYVKLGRDGGEATSVAGGQEPIDPAVLAEKHWHECVRLIDDFLNRGRGFASQPFPKFLKAYAEYDHLARVREWSVGEDEGAGGDA